MFKLLALSAAFLINDLVIATKFAMLDGFGGKGDGRGVGEPTISSTTFQMYVLNWSFSSIVLLKFK